MPLIFCAHNFKINLNHCCDFDICKNDKLPLLLLVHGVTQLRSHWDCFKIDGCSWLGMKTVKGSNMYVFFSFVLFMESKRSKEKSVLLKSLSISEKDKQQLYSGFRNEGYRCILQLFAADDAKTPSDLVRCGPGENPLMLGPVPVPPPPLPPPKQKQTPLLGLSNGAGLRDLCP